MLLITATAAVASVGPNGSPATARRWFSNWDVRAPSMAQCPVLCGRIASSFTTTDPSASSISSTARSPTTPSSDAAAMPRAWSASARSADSAGAGVVVSADAVGLDGLGHGVGQATAIGPADHDDRQFAVKSMNSSARITGRGPDADVAESLRRSEGTLERREGDVRVGVRLDLEDALTVIAAARQLGDDGPAGPRPKATRSAPSRRRATGAAVECREPRPHHRLVLGVLEGRPDQVERARRTPSSRAADR